MIKKSKSDSIQYEVDSIKNQLQEVEKEIENLRKGVKIVEEGKQEVTSTKQREKEKVAVAIYNSFSGEVTDQVDLNVPSTNNLTEVCDFCEEKFTCDTCIIEFLKENKHIYDED